MPHLLPHRAEVFHKRPTEEVLENVFYSAVQEHNSLPAVKGLLPTQGTDKPSTKFPSYSREEDDQDRTVNACVMVAATLLVLLTLSVVFFLFKSSELVVAREKTITTEEPTVALRPRGLGAMHSTSEAMFSSERSLIGIIHTTDEEESGGEAMDGFTEPTRDGANTLHRVR
ncbi:uncharacterized protein LOC144123822 [Amblyomma americanum]